MEMINDKNGPYLDAKIVFLPEFKIKLENLRISKLHCVLFQKSAIACHLFTLGMSLSNEVMMFILYLGMQQRKLS